MLHKYEGEWQAARKSVVANKKNRLLVIDCEIQVPAESKDDRHEFMVCAAQGQIHWSLAAASPADQDQWVRALSMSNGPGISADPAS